MEWLTAWFCRQKVVEILEQRLVDKNRHVKGCLRNFVAVIKNATIFSNKKLKSAETHTHNLFSEIHPSWLPDNLEQYVQMCATNDIIRNKFILNGWVERVNTAVPLFCCSCHSGRHSVAPQTRHPSLAVRAVAPQRSPPLSDGKFVADFCLRTMNNQQQ